MDQVIGTEAPRHRRRALLKRVERVASYAAGEAAVRDEKATFPDTELEALRQAGALAACAPGALGGLGFGTDELAALDTFSLLRCIGAASLPLGRIFEGHLNAVRYATRLGDEGQARQAAEDARSGHLFGVWATDDAADPLRIEGNVLRGAKVLASGAGHVTRAVVTASEKLLLVPLLTGERADLAGWTAQGMRASATGRVSFDGIEVGTVQRLGQDGAYLVQPDFSGGAWRASAVAMGGLDALVSQLCMSLVARGRQGNSHQQARVGATLIAQETATLWLRRAAQLAEAERREVEQTVAYVGLARLAVESACLDAMRLVQRSLGLASFMRPAPVERICRDLATYLRQPAPDETLTEAASWFLQHPLPAA